MLFPVVLLFQLNSGIPPAGGLSKRPSKETEKHQTNDSTMIFNISLGVICSFSLSLSSSSLPGSEIYKNRDHHTKVTKMRQKSRSFCCCCCSIPTHTKEKKNTKFFIQNFFLTRHLRGSRVYM